MPSFRPHAPSPAMVVACIALLVALGGTSYGLATGSINSREIKDNTIRSRDVRNRSLLAKDFKRGQLRAGRTGPTGPPGPRGPQGPAGTAAADPLAGRAALEWEGAGGIDSVARGGWAGAPSDARLRISRATPDDRGARYFLITPYQYGMALEYPGVVEAWVTDFSIHGPRHGVPARFWVGDDTDTGGIFMRAHKSPTEAWSEIASQAFTGAGHGPLRLRTVNSSDPVEIWSGSDGAATREEMLGSVGPSSAAGIKFGASGDTSLYRPAANLLSTDGKLTSAAGLGVGNSAPATALGGVVRKMEVFDASGAPLGYVPIYDAIN